MTRLTAVFAVLAVLPFAPGAAHAQADLATAWGPTLESIAQLEGQRDPKCYATAARLEDFMYGTPLSDDARFAKHHAQKDVVLVVWRLADRAARAAGHSEVTAGVIEPITQTVLPRTRHESGDWTVETSSGETLELSARDVRQYGNVAYALRAVLAVQQERLMVQDEDLLPLSDGAVVVLKAFLDVYTLSALQQADGAAREGDCYTIDVETFLGAWGRIGHAPEAAQPAPRRATGADPDPHYLTRQVIAQKIAAYEAYNRIAMPVFLRNIQVYFARHRWPADPELSNGLKTRLTEAMIDFTVQVLEGVERLARERAHALVQVEDVATFVHRLVPHRLNEFEDAVFFPALPRRDRVYIEAYDMDAFRDGGLHWQYLGAAIGEPEYAATLPPDPFALELITENIAQFGVLVLRLAGDAALAAGHDTLRPEHLAAALDEVQARVARHAQAESADSGPVRLASSANSAESPEASGFFTEITGESGVDFVHRSSDWLNRLIRSYTVRDGEVAVLAVPPAFGGSGAAAEDLNGDGYPDLLLLSGSGNRLYLNNRDGAFRDATAESGLSWARPDGTPGEPRQPIIADFDNDGVQDIFISYANDADRLYRGLGGARFENVTASAGLGGDGLVGGPATALDYDQDGLLDLYIGYFGQYTEGVLPTLARVNTNGLPNRLFRNTGGFVFEDVTDAAGVAGHGWTQAVGHTDFDGDGRQDIIEGNDFGTNPWYRNNGDGTFTDRSAELGTDKPSYTMGIGIGDLNDDLRPDVYISNIVTMDKDQKYVDPSDETRMKFDPETMATMRVVEANDLFVSRTEGDYEQSTAIDRGRAATGWSWGADFADFDNDGDDDLYVSNGMNEFAVYSSENPYYRDPEGKERDVVFPQPSRERNVLFVNEGGRLEYAAGRSGADLLGNTRAVVHADIDGDGDLDMVLNNYHDAAVVYRNNSGSLGRHWLSIRLKGDPESGSTADAIGALLLITTESGDRIWREVHSTSGYLTSHPKSQHVGLGGSGTASIEVRWPDGSVDRFADVAADQRLRISQRDGALTVVR